MAFGHFLEVIHERDIDGGTGGGADDGDGFGGDLFGDHHAEAGGEGGEEADGGGGGFGGGSATDGGGGGFGDQFGEGGADGPVGRFGGVIGSGIAAEGKDLEAGESIFDTAEVMSLAGGDLGDGPEHEGGGEGEFDDQGAEAEGAAEGAGGAGGDFVPAVIGYGGAGEVEGTEGDLESLMEGGAGEALDQAGGGGGEELEAFFDGRPDQIGEADGDTGGGEQVSGAGEVLTFLAFEKGRWGGIRGHDLDVDVGRIIEVGRWGGRLHVGILWAEG